MISQKMSDRINEQINRELHSAYLYLAMSARMTELGYKGAAKWLMIQYHEEMFHAMKFVGYLEDQGARVELKAIAAPQVGEGGLKELFERVLEHERSVTASIRGLADLAAEERDYASQGLLSWYVAEQVEEERNASGILQALALLGGNAQGAYLLNRELGERKLGVPSDFSAMGGAE